MFASHAWKYSVLRPDVRATPGLQFIQLTTVNEEGPGNKLKMRSHPQSHGESGGVGKVRG